MLVCLCHPASERDVDACIAQGARSVDAIGAACGAGTGCGSCLDELRQRLALAGCDGEAADAPGDWPPPRGRAGAGCAPALVPLRARAD